MRCVRAADQSKMPIAPLLPNMRQTISESIADPLVSACAVISPSGSKQKQEQEQGPYKHSGKRETASGDQEYVLARAGGFNSL